MADNFSSTLIAMHQRITTDMQARLNAETLRRHALEQLCNEQHALLHSVPYEPVTSADGEMAWHERLDAAETRYRELFGEETSV